MPASVSVESGRSLTVTVSVEQRGRLLGCQVSNSYQCLEAFLSLSLSGRGGRGSISYMVAEWLYSVLHPEYSVLLLHINAVGFQCRRAGMLCYAGV